MERKAKTLEGKSVIALTVRPLFHLSLSPFRVSTFFLPHLRLPLCSYLCSKSGADRLFAQVLGSRSHLPCPPPSYRLRRPCHFTFDLFCTLLRSLFTVGWLFRQTLLAFLLPIDLCVTPSTLYPCYRLPLSSIASTFHICFGSFAALAKLKVRCLRVPSWHFSRWSFWDCLCRCTARITFQLRPSHPVLCVFIASASYRFHFHSPHCVSFPTSFISD